MVVGVTGDVVRRVLAGAPLMVSSMSVRIRPAFEVYLFGGRSVAALRDELRGYNMAVPYGTADDEPLVADMVWTPPTAALPRPVVVLGITDAFAMRLLGGRMVVEHTVGSVTGRPAPRLHLRAAMTLDAVAQACVAGDPTWQPRFGAA